MAKVANRAKMTVTSTGTGALTLGAAVSGFQNFSDAGVLTGDLVSYGIEDGSNFEIGTGTYNGTTLTRTPVQSSATNNALITVTTSAVVYLTPLAADLAGTPGQTLVQEATSGELGSSGTWAGPWRAVPNWGKRAMRFVAMAKGLGAANQVWIEASADGVNTLGAVYTGRADGTMVAAEVNAIAPYYRVSVWGNGTNTTGFGVWTGFQAGNAPTGTVQKTRLINESGYPLVQNGSIPVSITSGGGGVTYSTTNEYSNSWFNGPDVNTGIIWTAGSTELGVSYSVGSDSQDHLSAWLESYTGTGIWIPMTPFHTTRVLDSTGAVIPTTTLNPLGGSFAAGLTFAAPVQPGVQYRCRVVLANGQANNLRVDRTVWTAPPDP